MSRRDRLSTPELILLNEISTPRERFEARRQRRVVTIAGQTLYAVDADRFLEDESNHNPARPGYPFG